jgi:hypothetical protein
MSREQKRISFALLAMLVAAGTSADAQRVCKKGIPCGGTCISASKTCHVGSASSAPQTPEQAAQSAVDDTLAAFVLRTRGALSTCAGKISRQLATIDSSAAGAVCADSIVLATEPDYNRIVMILSSDSAKAPMRDYYATWSKAVHSLTPRARELGAGTAPAMMYMTRFRDLYADVTMASARLLSSR